eukprot:748174-Hanusia_phi.AAC.2
MLIEANISTIRAIKSKIAEYEDKQEGTDGVNSSNGSANSGKQPAADIQARSMVWQSVSIVLLLNSRGSRERL